MPIEDPESSLNQVAAEYEERTERDRAALERMVFYAQTGLCRWRVLLEYFEQSATFTDFRCGRCDNCMRPVDTFPTESKMVETSPPPRWKPGAQVIVPRYGRGEVLQASAHEAEVRFPNGTIKRFVAGYVRDAS